MTLNSQNDKPFNFSREIGGKQAIGFLHDKQSPMGLSHILFNHPLEDIYNDSKSLVSKLAIAYRRESFLRFESCHARESGHLKNFLVEIPAFAGMTTS